MENTIYSKSILSKLQSNKTRFVKTTITCKSILSKLQSNKTKFVKTTITCKPVLSKYQIKQKTRTTTKPEDLWKHIQYTA